MAEENSDRPTFCLYNKMTKKKEVFTPKVPNKTIRRATEHKEKDPDHPLSDPLNLSNHYCQEFLRDMDDLQCLLPTHQPCVSDHMDQIRDMIAKIIEKGCAYPLDGDVYFSVAKFPDYGKLSKRKLEDNRAGERVSVDSRQQHPTDFALWKSAKPSEPSWDSPWGPGRPGWHIECSAMSAHYLTFSFDIHGGGMDLIFPHHENELAQVVLHVQRPRLITGSIMAL